MPRKVISGNSAAPAAPVVMRRWKLSTGSFTGADGVVVRAGEVIERPAHVDMAQKWGAARWTETKEPRRHAAPTSAVSQAAPPAADTPDESSAPFMAAMMPGGKHVVVSRASGKAVGESHATAEAARTAAAEMSAMMPAGEGNSL